jgi:hypothetical protein
MTDILQELADGLGGKIDEAALLPDGSGFAIMSMPLRKDHWIYGTPDVYDAPPMPLRMGTDNPKHNAMVQAIWAAAKYAVRGATMSGKDMDFDPDALCQNMVVGLIGYYTPDGLTGTGDDWANPDPVPPLFVVPPTL